MSYYTVRRDDEEIRVVICPKCKKADVIRTQKRIPYKIEGYLASLWQCESCKSYFSFYEEDGTEEITETQAENAMKKKYGIDMQKDGLDSHGHSFYILFKSKPPTMSEEKFDELMGFLQDEDGVYSMRNEEFKYCVDIMPSVDWIIDHRNFLDNIDFKNMSYLTKTKNKLSEYFDKKD